MPDRAAPQDLTTLAGLKLGNYRLERVVGRGRMGVVYVAKDEALLRPTAIKVLSWRVAEANGQDPVQWFLAEARLVARINHPRVVQIYGAARAGEYCYIAMEYVAGQSAEAVVARGVPMPPEAATDVIVQAASALHAAHRSGVVHRDVKPANLLVGEGGVTKLGDFGMALGPAEARLGNAHLRVGTPYYTAPEIWRGEPASPASDIYSLGATYFHLLTARPPYPGDDVASVEQAHLRAPVPDPRELVPSLPASCAALVRRALAKAPHDRHASAQELLFEARRVLQDLQGLGPPPPARGAPAAAPEPPAPALPAAPPHLSELGFLREPFGDVDAASFPALAAPLAAARARLLERLDGGAATLTALTGADGSGAAALLRQVAAELARSRLVLAPGAAPDGRGPGLVQRLSIAAGRADAPEDLEALVALLGDERRRRGRAPVVILDCGTGASLASPALASVVRAARASGSFRIVMAGAPGLAEEIARAGLDAGGERAAEIAVEPLDRDGLAAHLRAWLEATLAPHAPPIILTPDALLLVGLRSGGALERVSCIAANMLQLAAAERRRTVCSWYAWIAPDRERWPAPPGVELPRRPEGWPPAEVVDVIDACRRAVGMPPWPRTGARRS